MNQLSAKLRICASCEWIFTQGTTPTDCPKCGFAHYGARYVYGDRAYRYAKTQEPWLQRKLAAFRGKLQEEINELDT